MSVWISKVNGWLQQQVEVPQYPSEPDEIARDATLLRTMAVFSVVMLVVMMLIARTIYNRGDAWLALLLGDL